MADSSFKVFSIYKRVSHVFYDENYEMASMIWTPVGRWMFNRTPSFIKNQCFRIHNEIANSWYSYYDYVMVLVHNSLWDTHADLKVVGCDSVNKVKSLFCRERLDDDKNKVININKKVKLNDIDDFFKIREKGDSLIYDLIVSKQVSLYFFIHFFDKIKTATSRPRLQFDKSKKYQKLEKVSELLRTFNLSEVYHA